MFTKPLKLVLLLRLSLGPKATIGHPITLIIITLPWSRHVQAGLDNISCNNVPYFLLISWPVRSAGEETVILKYSA